MDDLIRRLQTRLKNSLDCEPSVVYHLSRALKTLEEIKTLRDNRPTPRGRKTQ